MLLLDTNVVSEAMRRKPDQRVLAWLREQPPERLYLSAVTIAEIHYGLELLTDRDRRLYLQNRFTMFAADGFQSRVIDFGSAEAATYGAVMARRRRAGRPMTVPDAQIAATAISAGLSLVTRNTRDFHDVGLELVNPFTVTGG